jgi:hypothetical protein
MTTSNNFPLKTSAKSPLPIHNYKIK